MGIDHHKLSREKKNQTGVKQKDHCDLMLYAAKETSRRKDNHSKVSSWVLLGSEVT